MPHQIEMPMNTANYHAASADEFVRQGLLVLATEEHHKASEALLVAIGRSHDDSAKRTLRLLYNKHRKERDELQKRIEKLKSEGKDPNLPQMPEHPAGNPYPGQNTHTPTSNVQDIYNPTYPAQQYPPPMSDSQNTVDESFMVLGGQRSDPGDAFNHFWTAMQGMLDNLSQPVAFATAPLGIETPSEDTSGTRTPSLTSGRRGSWSSDTDTDDYSLPDWSRKIGTGRERSRVKVVGRPKATPAHGLHDNDFGDDDDYLESGDDLSGSFCLIPSGTEPSLATLRKDNAKLTAELVSTKERLAATEQLLRSRKEQDMVLRNSIFEAQRAISASGILPRVPGDANFLNFNKPQVPIPSLGSGREAQYSRRIQELEGELRAVKAENEKNKMMITKFRERWEKLKESAKRKKEAKVAAEGQTNGVRDRILEEPEAEEELDGFAG